MTINNKSERNASVGLLLATAVQILSIHFDETFCGNLVNNFDCQAFNLFETMTGSRITTIAILWYAQAWIISPLQIHNNFKNPLAIPNKHRIIS